MSRVNLLPSEIKKGQETRRRFILFLLAGVAIVLLVIAFWFVQSMHLGDVQSQIDAQNQTNASIQSQIRTIRAREAARQRLLAAQARARLARRQAELRRQAAARRSASKP